MTSPAAAARTIHGAFAAVAEAAPGRPAVVHGGRTVTYGELHARADAMSGALRGAVAPEEPVGLCAARSADAVAGALGILAAGGAYVPLDPRLPDARLAHLVRDSGMRRIATDEGHVARVRCLAPGVEVVRIDELARSGSGSDGRSRAVPAGAARLAYVVYTSGSTGRPNGVLVEHGGVVARVRDSRFAVTAADVFLQLAPPHADPSVFETWCPLLNGATLALPPEGELGVHEIGEQVVRHGVTVLRLVAPLFRLMVETNIEALRGLRLVISGGDRASERAVRRALAEVSSCAVVNGYGPTETTVYACCHAMRAYDDRWPSPPIGTPLDGVAALVLDADLRPVADGEAGELCLAGAGVARGYLGRPDLTAGRFVPHPLRSGARLYRTGDRARRLPDGNLEFLGRTDHQVKIRGYRIELGEVERALASHPEVDEAAAVVREHGEVRQLTAVVTARDGAKPSVVALRRHLARRLPEYMVPAVVERVAALPRTSNGKIDRRALAAPLEAAHRPDGGRAPGTELERRLVAIWADVLGRPGIGPDDSFFDAGGDSLAAMAIAARVTRELGAPLSISTVLETTTVRALAAAIEPAGGAPGARTAPPEPGPSLTRAPLLPAQQGVWYEDQLVAGGRYGIARTYRVEGPVDEPALRAALAALAERQHALRTVIVDDPDGLWQVVREDRGPSLERVHLDGLPPAEREARARSLIDEARRRPVPLSEGPLLRLLLVSMGESRWLLHLDVHHLVADDWSLDVLFDELAALYYAACRDRPAALPPLEAQYVDLAAADRAAGEAALARAHASLGALLDGYEGSIALPADLTPPDLPSGRGGRVRVELEPALSAAVTRLSRDHRVSRYMLALAAVYLLLARYAQQRDICVGTPVAGRGRPGTERLIGYFVNMLAVRIRPADQLTVAGLLRHVRDVCLEVYRHQDVPFHALARRLGLEARSGRFPLFQVVVAYQQRPPRPLRLPGAEVTEEPAETDTSKFDLAFAFEEVGDGLGLEIEFSADLFERRTIEGMGRHLRNVLRWMVTHPQDAAAEVEMLDADEERVVRVTWNRTERDLPVHGCLHDAVVEQARRRPGEIAVVGDDGTLTYGELERRSDRLAALLVKRGLRLEDRVAVCLPRSAGLVASILGVLKAGGTYVPLDPAYPTERLRLIVQDARAHILVTTAGLQRDLPARAEVAVLDVERLPQAPAAGRFAPPQRPGPSNLAYIIYTSGSTGRPRGVAIEHRSALNTLHGHLSRFTFTASDVWSQFAASGFDMAIYEQFMPLLTGATSVICSDAVKMDGRTFVEFVNGHGVTVLVLSPAFLRALGRPELPSVRYVITGGETASMEDVRHYARTKQYLNAYGPTEACMCVTTYRATGDEVAARLPVGGPLPNTRLYVLDERLRLAPVGVPGELFIGGTGLARGYWNDPDLTHEKFGPVPSVGPERLYRTGDRVRWLPDGTLDFLGRLNRQVKLRGYRIELGEIETVLGGCPGVDQAVVVLNESAADRVLVAFVVGPAGEDELRQHLLERLPRYMVPGSFVRLERMPMTEHAKVDRALLGRLAADAGRRRGVQAAVSPLEERVTAIWRALLGVPEVGPEDDFYSLGGHSLLIVRLLRRVESELGVRVGARQFLAEPTVRGLAAQVSRATSGRAAREEPAVPESEARLDPALRFSIVRRPARAPEALLLTGATGFVGVYLLRELLRRTSAEVRCLVRAPSSGAARDRLRETLRAYGLEVDPDDPRVVVVPGDLALADLGVEPRARARLLDTVDAVIHAGAHVHHLSSYARLRAANVGGTHALLRLAAGGRPKRFHHVSSLSVFSGGTDARVVTEATPTGGERHLAGRGYSASKWVADRLVQRAAERGATCRIYRLGRVSGDTEAGAANPDDLFYRLLLSCAALGCYPTDAGANLLPVDLAARAIVALALDDDSARLVHHLHQAADVRLEAFMTALDRRRGSRSEAVPPAEWAARVRRAAAAGRQLAILPYEHVLEELSETSGGGSVHYANEATRDELGRLRVSIPPVDTPLIERYWRFLERGGHLT